MRLVRYAEAGEFRTRIWPLLIAREAENNLLIGIIGQLAKGASVESVGGTGRPGFWTVEADGRVVAAAAITPPHRLLLTQMTATAVEEVASGLRREGLSIPGVVAPRETAEQFAEQWSRRSGHTFRLGHAMRIYQLKKVIHPGEVPGRMATAGMGDFDLLREWNDGFSTSVRAHVPATPERVRQRIQDGETFLWRTPAPVSMAHVAGPTPNGIRISAVYTPPEHRCHGYASALVASVSQRMLDSGRAFCFLFTDLANPTSNSIYQRIGYRPVCDFAEYDFVGSGECEA
jgi:hypothetical protein